MTVAHERIKSDNKKRTLPTSVLNGKTSQTKQALTCRFIRRLRGLSLGMELAGFRPLLFSELNISAAETYMLNRLGQNIIPIGDVYSLTDANLKLLRVYWKQEGIEDIDLVCGGPPCQGYSGIAKCRTFKLDKEEIPLKPSLRRDGTYCLRAVNPAMFLFENVRGLLSARWDKNGGKGEIFRDVLKAFRTLEGYHIRWDLVHAKDYGVPQNRPRVALWLSSSRCMEWR